MKDNIIKWVHISWSEFHKEARKLADKLKSKKWIGIIAVARGGLIPASIIARELNIRTLDIICPSQYDGDIEIIKRPTIQDSSDLLIVDEFVNTGLTYRKVREVLPKAFYSSVYVTEVSKNTINLYSKELKNEDLNLFPWDTKLMWSKPISEMMR